VGARIQHCGHLPRSESRVFHFTNSSDQIESNEETREMPRRREGTLQAEGGEGVVDADL
jgi:hypothetical protein